MNNSKGSVYNNGLFNDDNDDIGDSDILNNSKILSSLQKMVGKWSAASGVKGYVDVEYEALKPGANGQSNQVASFEVFNDSKTLEAFNPYETEQDYKRDFTLPHKEGTKYKDYIYGAANGEIIFGWEGSDTIIGYKGTNIIFGGAGDDLIKGGYDEERLYGGTGHDLIAGGAGRDYITGGNGNDLLYGEDGHDLLFGDEGNDYLNGGAGDDVLIAGKGAPSSNNILFGDYGDDIIIGSTREGSNDQFGDQIKGGAGNDIIYARGGNNTIQGQAGSDIYLFTNLFADSGLTVINNYAKSHIGAEDMIYFYGMTKSRMDPVTGKVTGDVEMSGRDYDLYISFPSYNESGQKTARSEIYVQDFFRYESNEVHEFYFDSAAEKNPLYKLADLEAETMIFNVNIASANAGKVSGTYNHLWRGKSHIIANAGIQNVINIQTTNGVGHTIDAAKTTQNNHLNGGNGNDTIYGGIGRDQIKGGVGNDLIIGGQGDDILEGGAGSDTYVINRGDGHDVISNYDTSSNRQDTILFTDITKEELNTMKLVNNDLVISRRDGSDTITVRNYAGGAGYQVDIIEFKDGFKLGRNDIAQWVLGGGNNPYLSAKSASSGTFNSNEEAIAQDVKTLTANKNDKSNASSNSIDQDIQSLISAMSTFGNQGSAEDSLNTDTGAVTTLLLAANN